MYTTLNISATSIKLLSLTRGIVKKWGGASLAPGLIKDGLILQPKAVGAAIDALFKSTKVPKEQVIVSLTGLTFSYRFLSFPRMKSALLEEAIRRGVRKEMPLPLEELCLTWQVIGRENDELDFLVLGVPRNLIDAIVETLIAAGIKPYVIDLKPLALARAANRRDIIIANLEPDCFDIILVVNGIPAIMHTVTPRGEEATLEDNIQRLSDELLKTVKYYDSSHEQNPLSPETPLLLTGELASEPATSELIQAQMEYPLEPLVPALKFPADLPITLYASNIGLAMKKTPPKTTAKGEATRYHDVNLNILSGKYRSEARPVKLRNILIPIAFTVAISLLFPLYQVKSQATATTIGLQTRLSAITQELQTTRQTIDEAKQTEVTINEILTNADTIQKDHRYILSRGRGFATNLTLVTDALPPGARFTRIEINSRRITVNGKAESATSVIRYAVALEKNKEFAAVRIADISESYITENEDSQAETQEAQSAVLSFTIVITTLE